MFQVETVGKVGFPCGDVIFVPILAEAMKRLSIPPRVFSKAPPQEKYRTSNGSRRWIKKPLSALFGAKNCADREILDVWKRGDMRSTRNGQCIFIYQIPCRFHSSVSKFYWMKMHKLFIRFLQISEIKQVELHNFNLWARRRWRCLLWRRSSYWRWQPNVNVLLMMKSA